MKRTIFYKVAEKLDKSFVFFFSFFLFYQINDFLFSYVINSSNELLTNLYRGGIKVTRN